MNITANAASLGWRTNNKGVWKALVKDMAPDTPVVFDSGLTGTVAGKQVTVEAPSMPTGFMTYTTDDDTSVYGGVLYGAGNVSDSLEAVGGEKTVRMGSVDLGTPEWTEGTGVWTATLADVKSGTTCLVSDNGYTMSVSGTTLTVTSTTSPTGTLYYELATPTTSTETTQSMSLEQGSDTIGGGSFSATYEGTEYTIQLIKGCKYIHRDEAGTDHYITPNTAIQLSVRGGVSKLLDLTRWFGSTLEPTTIAGLYALYPTWKTYDIPYTEGIIVNYKGTGVQTIGFNAYNHATGTAELLGGNKYQICGTYTSVSYVDQWGDLEELELDDKGIFTPINDGTLTVIGGNATDTCVHLCWSGYKNFGEDEYQWEPYTKNVHVFPVTQHFTEGMNGIDGVSDELYTDSKIQNIKKIVFTGDETFSYTSGVCRYGVSDRLGRGRYTDVLCNMLTPISQAGTGRLQWDGPASPNIAMTPPASWGITSEAAFKVKLKELYDAGTPLVVYYISKTPVTTQLPSPINLAYPVNDFGTEQSLPVNTTDLVTTDLHALIRYNTDYMRMNTQLSEIFPTVRSLAQQEQAGEIMKTDATAPNATVGNAYNLIDRNAQGTERQFSFDTAGGTQDITDGTAIAKKVMGTTLNLNQLVRDTNENTVESVDGNATVSDAVDGQVKHLVVSGDTVVVNQLVHEYVEKTESGTGRIWIKDAFEKEAKGLKVTAPVSTVENQAVHGVTPALTLNGANSPFTTAPQEMFGVDGATDEYDVVNGKFYKRTAIVDLSTLSWVYQSTGAWAALLPEGIAPPDSSQVVNTICTTYTVCPSGASPKPENWLNTHWASANQRTAVAVKAISDTVTPTGLLLCELETSVVTDVTPVAFNLVSHDNTIIQTSGDLQSGIEATYDGLNQTIALDPAHTYAFNHQYVEDSIITGESSIDCVGTEDNLVDLTQLYAGDATRIAAIHSWASLSSRIHMYRDWLPYNPGEIVNLSATIRVYRHEHAYGVVYDPSQSSPVCQRVELNDGVLTEVESFTSLSAHEKFYRCVMDDLSTRHINYYLDDEDSTKKYNGTRNGVTSDGTSSVLTGADGDVMVEIPITYWSLDEDYNGTGKILWLVSDTPFTGSEIHDFFYVSPNGDEARTQYVGAYRAVVADAEGNALNTTEGAITQNAGTAATRLLRSVAGALPFNSVNLAAMREAAVRNGGSHVNHLFHEYLLMMMIVEQATLNTQSISMGYSNGKTNALWAWRKSGRTNYGNGTGQTLAVANTGDDDNFYSLKVNNVQLYRDANRDADGYFAWSNHTATPTVYWTESNSPGNGATAYSDSAGTDSGYTTTGWSTTADANKVIQFQYRGIENPFGECWEFDDGMQKYQKAILTVIRVNNILHYVNHLKDGTGTKTAWTSEDGTSTYWTITVTPGNNSVAYSDAVCTVDSGYKITQTTFIRVDCEMWESVATADYTSTDQHAASTKVYNKNRHYWPSGSWIKKFDPRSFLPRTLGGGATTYLCDNWYNDNGTGSRVVYVGGYANNGSSDGMAYRNVNYGLANSSVSFSGRLSA